MKVYETLTEALKDLNSRGFTADFNIAFDKLICTANNTCLNPTEFEIVEFYRFEGDTDPGDQNIVYAIESKDGTIKGSLTAAFGTYADTISAEMIQKLSIHK